MVDDALDVGELEVLHIVGKFVAAVRGADSTSEQFPGQAAMDAVVGCGAEHPGPVGEQAMMTFVFLTGGDFGAARLDAVTQMLQADQVDPRVLDALRPARSIGQSKAAPSGNTEARSASETPRPDPIALDDAAAELREMLRSASGAGPVADRFAAWRAFTEFARRPAVATPPRSLAQDTCFFEGCAHERADRMSVEWVFTRQFVIDAVNGEYDHMEQLRLTVSFTADAHVEHAAASPMGGVWAGSDLLAWAAEVEGLEAFAVPADEAVPIAIDIVHENV